MVEDENDFAPALQRTDDETFTRRVSKYQSSRDSTRNQQESQHTVHQNTLGILCKGKQLEVQRAVVRTTSDLSSVILELKKQTA